MAQVCNIAQSTIRNKDKMQTDFLLASKPIYRLMPLLQGIPTGEKTNKLNNVNIQHNQT